MSQINLSGVIMETRLFFYQLNNNTVSVTPTCLHNNVGVRSTGELHEINQVI